ncbi:hypothetical protein DPZ44_01200 [Salmonella enterica subsp. salamae]|uniref:Uncharacterized protein n=1 Tax=Salmonella enterica subsp. salamae TaxID=59202 RepID=A0A5Y2LYS6_SALER|nr:hypothetical protein [Salmonella enterica]ECE6362479.1 hypothetical protein [Salmonella enterica subsp. salamae]ECI4257557.1 hypothetical protein [Salmonella enterica subsp. salamae]ECI5306164.1 hypothetical protein [Salmonella enterica subsp. salamae]
MAMLFAARRDWVTGGGVPAELCKQPCYTRISRNTTIEGWCSHDIGQILTAPGQFCAKEN